MKVQLYHVLTELSCAKACGIPSYIIERAYEIMNENCLSSKKEVETDKESVTRAVSITSIHIDLILTFT